MKRGEVVYDTAYPNTHYRFKDDGSGDDFIEWWNSSESWEDAHFSLSDFEDVSWLVCEFAH